MFLTCLCSKNIILFYFFISFFVNIIIFIHNFINLLKL